MLTETDGGLPHRWSSAAGGVGDEHRRTVVAGPDREQRRHDRRLQPRGHAARTTYYRFVFEGTDTYATVTSDTLTVKVKPVLGTPTCPSSVKTSKSFTVKGTVAPGAPSGPAVKIQAYRKHDGKWSKYKSAYSTTRSGINFSVKIKIKDTGTFKFKATVAASSKFVAVNEQLQQGDDGQEVDRTSREGEAKGRRAGWPAAPSPLPLTP